MYTKFSHKVEALLPQLLRVFTR